MENLSINKAHGTDVSNAEVRFERLLPGPIETVWEYITDSEKRGTWLASGPMELKVGGKVRFHFLHSSLSDEKTYPDKFKQMENGVYGDETVVAIDPPRSITITWAPDSEVNIELVEKGEDVLLTLRHYKLVDDGVRLLISAGWHSHLDILVSKLYKQPVPKFWQNFLKYELEYEKMRAGSKV
ncbi:SRPBCC family protein [Leptospira langatensis]|uniref:SRPBCC family protein n=1 Tax=Leptospira langatensis TaxID=2484983 RepID=A0A5F1ZZ25_9LEPT|nr:SRPBCC family protein [Leptospira langatensis]TGJ98587.1 SRPBCC family protein [Leptospira langatensis]TGL43500.1 SRPBCC family protein [Leptospira langatensis]